MNHEPKIRSFLGDGDTPEETSLEHLGDGDHPQDRATTPGYPDTGFLGDPDDQGTERYEVTGAPMSPVESETPHWPNIPAGEWNEARLEEETGVPSQDRF